MITRSSNHELPQMLGIRAVELMRTAIRSPPGIRIVTSDHRSALTLRRQLYGARRRARERSDTSMDGLSIIVKGSDVRLVVRSERLGAPIEGIAKILPLRWDEVPAIIGSRGPQRLGLLDALAVLDVLAKRRLPTTIR